MAELSSKKEASYHQQGPSQDKGPTKEQLFSLSDNLYSIRNKWKVLARGLGLDAAAITEILESRQDPVECLNKTFEKWYQSSHGTANYSWTRLIEALQCQSLEVNPELVKRISQMYYSDEITDGQPTGKPQKSLQHQLSKEGKKESGRLSAVRQSLSNTPANVGKRQFRERQLSKEYSEAIQLISFSDNKLSVNSKAHYLISTIDKPVAVLSICGPTRTGKSYLMSKIVGSDVFEVTNLINPCTKGIWMSPIILETEDMAVIFLDSEGMDAPQSDHNLNGEVEMFVILIVLLSSYLIYNTKGEATIQFLESLRYFGECSKKMLVDVQQREHGSRELKALQEYFPDFLWLLRDSTLVPVNDSNEQISIEEYMEEKVLVVEGDPKSKKDEAKMVLKEAFPSRSFKQMPYPGNTVAPDAKDFLQAIEDTKKAVLQNIKPKYGLNEDHGLKGPYLARLLTQYVDSLNNDGGSIMLEKSYFNAIQIEVYQSIDSLVDIYTKEMRCTLTDQEANPLEEGDLAELQKSHAAMANDCVYNWEKFSSENMQYCTENHTLFACHLKIYHDLLQSLCETMEKLLSKNYRESCNKLKNDLIIVLEQRLVRIDLSAASHSEKVKLNCYLKQFMTENYQKSKDYCRESFEAAYAKQQDANSISIMHLKKSYFSLAIGPAKHDVYNSQISEIPEIPSNVKLDNVSYNSFTVSWKVPQSGEKVGQLVEAYCSEDRLFKKYSLVVHKFQLSQGYYEFTGLKPSREYYIKVRGLAKKRYEKFGEFSELLSCKTPWSVPDKPSKPESITIDGANPWKATLVINLLSEEQKRGSPVTNLIIVHKMQTEWQVLKEVQAAHIESDVVITLPSLDDLEKFGSSNSFLFSAIMCNEFGQSQPSESITLPFKDLLPGKPTELSCKKSSAHAIELEWQRPALHKALPITFELEYSLVGKPAPKLTESIGAREDYFLTGLIPKSSYILTLKAKFNDFGPSTEPLHVNTVEYSSSGLCLKCKPPTSKSIKVEWQCPTEDRREVLHFDIECRKCELASYEKSQSIFKEDKNILSVNIPDLKPWTNYTVAVTPVFGINPELITGPTEKIQCSTLMGKTSKRTLKAAGTLVTSGAVAAVTAVVGASALAVGGFALVSAAALGVASYVTE